jgi:hypothetical protein
MSLHRLPDQVVRADPWTLFCAQCSQKMRITVATPAEDGRETRTYECACGGSEKIDVAIHWREAATDATSRVPPRSTIGIIDPAKVGLAFSVERALQHVVGAANQSSNPNNPHNHWSE